LRAAAAGVDNTRSSGVRVGNWLTPEQAKELLLAPNENTLKGKRDGALLGLLAGCALRRAELVSLLVDKIQMRDDRWVIPDLVGKRKKVRLVPVPGWVKDRLDLWTVAAKITEGKIFRAVGQNDKVSGSSLSTTAVWKIVLHYAHEVGIEHLAPHDLRRYMRETVQEVRRGSRTDPISARALLDSNHGKILGRRARLRTP